MKLLSTTRRRFFALAGATPLAAKTAVDDQIKRLMIGGDMSGHGNASLGLSYGIPADASSLKSGATFVPYEDRIIGASDYVSMFGMPETFEFELRDRARHIYMLDVDIASKQSWSMAVKVMTQRQRNYEREVEKIKRSGWVQRGREGLKKMLGFDWPWG